MASIEEESWTTVERRRRRWNPRTGMSSTPSKGPGGSSDEQQRIYDAQDLLESDVEPLFACRASSKMKRNLSSLRNRYIKSRRNRKLLEKEQESITSESSNERSSPEPEMGRKNRTMLSKSLQLTRVNIRKRFGGRSNKSLCDEVKSSSGISTAHSVLSGWSELDESTSSLFITDQSSTECHDDTSDPIDSVCFSSTMMDDDCSEDEDLEDVDDDGIRFLASSPVPPGPILHSMYKLEKCTKALSRDQCISSCPFVHEQPTCRYEPRPCLTRNLFDPLTERERAGILNLHQKISKQMAGWFIGMSVTPLLPSIRYVQSLQDSAVSNDKSILQPVSQSHEPTTKLGLLDVDAVYPCTPKSLCLIDNIVIDDVKRDLMRDAIGGVHMTFGQVVSQT